MKPHALRNAPGVSFPTLMITGIGGSLIVLGTYKFLLKPYFEKQRRLDNQEIAKMVYESRFKKKEKLED